MKILLNALYKGGIGKTTQNYVFAHLLARRGYRVLFIDFDPQMSGTRLLTGRDKNSEEFQEKNIFEGFKNDDLKSNILNLEPNLDYIAGNQYINLFEDIMERKGIAQFHLYIRALLKPFYEDEEYDIILLDMSPSKSKLNTSVMAAATEHIVVTQSEVLSMDMIGDYIRDVNELKDEYEIDTGILGISVGMKDSGTSISKSVVESIRNTYPDLMFSTIIRRRTRLQEYPVTGFPRKNNRKMYNIEDRKALELHNKLLNEVLERLGLPERKEERING